MRQTCTLRADEMATRVPSYVSCHPCKGRRVEPTKSRCFPSGSEVPLQRLGEAEFSTRARPRSILGVGASLATAQTANRSVVAVARHNNDATKFVRSGKRARLHDRIRDFFFLAVSATRTDERQCGIGVNAIGLGVGARSASFP